MKIKKYFIPIIDKIRRYTIRRLGGSTLGARAIVIDSQERVLLVKHTYRKGWHTPGGGVELNESPWTAIKRELNEEVGLNITDNPNIFHVYRNTWRNGVDYPIFYIIKKFENEPKICDPLEISQIKWFLLNNLPDDITPRTKILLEEYSGLREINDEW